MKLKEFIVSGLATLLIFCIVPTAKAGGHETLQENIKAAQIRYHEHETELKKVAGALFIVFTEDSNLYVRHKAEIEIREKYPKEYRNYMLAKMELDDLQYIAYIVKINSYK